MRCTRVWCANCGIAQVLGDAIGVSAVLAAMLGLSILLLTGVLSWKECLEYAAAWDTLFWFAVLVGAPPALTHAGTVLASCMLCGQSRRRYVNGQKMQYLNFQMLHGD